MLPDGSNATTPTLTEKPSSWAEEDVAAAVDAGIVPQKLQYLYTSPTNRSDFCALAVLLFENVVGQDITERSTFVDTDDVNVEKMAALGVVNGVGDNKFAPNTQITREEAATMLARLAEAMGKPLLPQSPAFNDNSDISSWAFDAAGQVQAAGIMGGVGDNTFAP